MQACPARQTAVPSPADGTPPPEPAPQPARATGPAISLSPGPLVPASIAAPIAALVASPGAPRGPASGSESAALSGLELLPAPVHDFILDLLPLQSRLCLERQVSKGLQTRLAQRARHDLALQRAANAWTDGELAAVLSDQPAQPFNGLPSPFRAAVLRTLIDRLPGLPRSRHNVGFRLLLEQTLRLPAPLQAAPLNALARCIDERAAVVDLDTLLDCAARIAAEPLAQSARLRRAALALERRAKPCGIASQLLPDASAALALARAFPPAEQAEALSICAAALARACASSEDAAAPWRALLQGVARDETDPMQRGRLIAELARCLPGIDGPHSFFGIDAATASQYSTLLLDTVFSLPEDGPFHALACLLGAEAPPGPFQYVRRTQRTELLDEIAQRMQAAALSVPQRLHLGAALLRFLPDLATWDALWNAATRGKHAATLRLLSAVLPLCQPPAPDATRLLRLQSAAVHALELPPSARAALLKDALYYGREAIDAAGLTASTLAGVAALARDHGEYGPLAQWAQQGQRAARHQVVRILQSLAPAQQVSAVRQWLHDGKWSDLEDLADLSALADPLAQTGHLAELADLARTICDRGAQWTRGISQCAFGPERRRRIEAAARTLADDWIKRMEAIPQCRRPATLAAAALFAHQLDVATDNDAGLVQRAWALIERLDADDLRACLADLRPLRRLEEWSAPAQGLQDHWPRSAVPLAARIVRTRLSGPERREWLAHLLGRLWVLESERQAAAQAARQQRFDSARQATWDLAISLPRAQWSHAACYLAEWFATPPDATHERTPWEKARASFHAWFGA